MAKEAKETRESAEVIPLSTPGSVPVITITNGVPTGPASGTVSTLDNVFDVTNGPVAIKAASTPPAASDKAIVVAISPNGVNANSRAAAASSAPVVISNEDFAVLSRLMPIAVPTVGIISKTRIVSAATGNSGTLVKGTAGQIYTLDVFNNASYNVFLKLFDAASIVIGTTVPIMTIPIQAGGGYSKTWPMGLPFATTIYFGITKNQADTDATQVAAGDLTGNLTWI